MASWPQLISYLLVAPAYLHVASDWPLTFFTPKVFLFSISLLFVGKATCRCMQRSKTFDLLDFGLSYISSMHNSYTVLYLYIYIGTSEIFSSSVMAQHFSSVVL